MTRTTIDFGIDLGTTNSAIAVLADGRPTVLRNNENQEITPSAVMIERNGAISVGGRAYSPAQFRPQTVACEFKRAMGTDQSLHLGGRSMTPEELSAEVLKVLCADAQRRLGEEVGAAVVTVPARFSLAACEATVRAARLAGIGQVPLLQEPIAAGLAYGLETAGSRAYWLVYDLGGGTFDVSLMTIREGRLNVLDTTGDQYLGGKDFDNLLVDYVVEHLQREYEISGPVRDADPYRKLYAKLKKECERVKIRLSQVDLAPVEISDVSDQSGTSIDTYVDVSRLKYQELIAALVSRTTKLALELLARNNFDRATIDRVIMVGGPTYTPFIRKNVRESLGIEIETRVDPMTVVAQGAAIFAGTVLREQGVSARKPVSKGTLSVDLKYNPVCEDTNCRIGGRIAFKADGGIFVQIERADGGWTSGRIPVTNGAFVAKLVLRERAANTFRLRAFDAKGTEISLVPDRCTITHGLLADDPPLSQSFGVVVEGPDGRKEMECLLPRGTRLPASAKTELKTVRAVGPGHTAAVSIYLLEGEAQRADRNDHVGHLRLDASNLPRPLPPGTDIEVTLSFDTSRTLSARVFVPYLDETFTVRIDDWKRPSPDVELLERLLHFEEERSRQVSQVTSVGDVRTSISQVERAIEEARSGDRDAKFSAQSGLRELQRALDEAEALAQLPLLEAEWGDLLQKAHQIVEEYGETADRQQLTLLEKEGNQALEARDQTRLRQRVEQLRELYWRILTAQDGYWIGLYQHFVEHQDEMMDQPTAKVLMRDGRRALDRQDFESLRRTCWRLWELMGGTQGSTDGFPDVNIRRA